MKLTKSLLLLLTLRMLLQSHCCTSLTDIYKSISGLLCVKPEFTRNFSSMKTLLGCATLCSRDQRCQAFSLADGPCQLFVFDKCSKSVRHCSCSRRGQVFVKQQPGLEAGALCPSGYGDDLCGVKYKLLPTGNWSVQRQRCESESGLVIMPDVTSSAEMTHISGMYTTRADNVAFWLGGFQPPGSAEPDGGWYWVACNLTINSTLWGSSEPSGGTEDAIFASIHLGDSRQSDPGRAGLCECLSPFD